LRVIAGLARGRHLKAPRGNWIRPTSDLVKESLFNILAAKVPGSVFLDLYAGSGGVGIEALSRGCARAVFVDISPRAVQYIKRNLYAVKLAGRARVYRMDALKSLNLFKKLAMEFDIIFIDPPYYERCETEVLEGVNEKNLLKKGGTFVAESSKKTILPSRVGNLIFTRRVEYGDTALNFYQVM